MSQCWKVTQKKSNVPPCSNIIIEIGEPEQPLWRKDDYAADNPDAPRINATLLALARNEELDGMLVSMRDLERTWNSKFNYPWTFFNDVPFSEDFKRLTQMETKAKCNFGELFISKPTLLILSLTCF